MRKYFIKKKDWKGAQERKVGQERKARKQLKRNMERHMYASPQKKNYKKKNYQKKKSM